MQGVLRTRMRKDVMVNILDSLQFMAKHLFYLEKKCSCTTYFCGGKQNLGRKIKMAVGQNMRIMKARSPLKLYVVQEFGQDTTFTREMSMEMGWSKRYIRLARKELDNQLNVMVKERESCKK